MILILLKFIYMREIIYYFYFTEIIQILKIKCNNILKF